MNIAWSRSNAQSQTLSTNQNSLFKIKVKALQAVSDLNSALSFDKDKAYIPTAFFNNAGCTDQVQLVANITPALGAGESGDREAANNTLSHVGQSQSTLLCYPNPTRDQVTIVFESLIEGSAQLSIINTDGREVFKQAVDIKKGINSIVLTPDQMLRLWPGVLNVLLVDQTGIKSGKLVKF